MRKKLHPKIEIKSNSINSTIVGRQRKDEFTGEIGWKARYDNEFFVYRIYSPW